MSRIDTHVLLAVLLALVAACRSHQDLGDDVSDVADGPDASEDAAIDAGVAAPDSLVPPSQPVPGWAGTSGTADASSDVYEPPGCSLDSAEACNERDDDCDGRTDEQRDCTIAVDVATTQVWPGFDDLAIDDAGNVFAAGTFESNVRERAQTLNGVTLTSAGWPDIMIAAITPSGELRWVTTLGSPAHDGRPALALHGGHLYLLGSLNLPGTIDVQGEARTIHGGFVAEISTDDGSVRWLTPLPTPELAGEWNTWERNGIGVAADGEIYVVLNQSGTDTGNRMYYGRLSPEGEVRYLREPVAEVPATWSGSVTISMALAVSADGRMFISGHSYSPADIGGCRLGELSPFLIALDSEGVCLWQHDGLEVEVPNLDTDGRFIELHALALTATGRLLAGGLVRRDGSLAGIDFVVTVPRYDLTQTNALVLDLEPETGEPGWLWQYGSPGADEAFDLASDASGNLYVGLGLWRRTEFFEGGGSGTISLAVVTSLDAQGSERWSRDILVGDTDEARDQVHGEVHALALAPDGSILTAASGTLTWLHGLPR